MKKQSRLKPTGTRTTAHRRRKMTREESLRIGRLPMAERKAHRRRLQKRRSVQRLREKRKGERMKLRLKSPEWRLLPDPAYQGRDSNPGLAEEEEEPQQRSRRPARGGKDIRRAGYVQQG